MKQIIQRIPAGKSGFTFVLLGLFLFLPGPVESLTAQVAGVQAGRSGEPQLRWEALSYLEETSGRSLDWDTMVRLALTVSGADENRYDAWIKQLDDLTLEAEAKLGSLPLRERADSLLQFLHQKIMKRYRATQTRLDTLLTNGDFNCVSSSVLYFIVGTRLGLELEATGTYDHAFCVLVDGRDRVDVETTTALGFDPGKKREFHDEFGKLTGFTYVPSGNYRTRNTLDYRGLLGLVLQNRAAEAQQLRDYALPVGLGWDRLALEKSPESEKFLDSSLNNYASLMLQQKHYQAGMAFVDRWESARGVSEDSRNARVSIVNNQAVEFLQSGKTDEARLVLETYGSLLGKTAQSLWDKLNQDELRALFAARGWREAVQSAEDRKNAGQMQMKFASEMQEYFLGQEINNYQKRQDWEGGLLFLGNLDAQYQGFSSVRSARSVFENNLAVEYYRRFAQAMNAGKKNDAGLILEEGLRKLPESEILKKGKQLFERS